MKKAVTLLVLILLVSPLALAECEGFLGNVKCFLVGDSELRGGWFERDALVGMAAGCPVSGLGTAGCPFQLKQGVMSITEGKYYNNSEWDYYNFNLNDY